MTDDHAHSWHISMRDYVDARFAASEKAVTIALEAAEKAVVAALLASEKAAIKSEQQGEEWRRSANEWRGAMVDREARFITEPAHIALLEKIDAHRLETTRLQSRMDLMQGTGMGRASFWGYVVAVITLALACGTLVLLFR